MKRFLILILLAATIGLTSFLFLREAPSKQDTPASDGVSEAKAVLVTTRKVRDLSFIENERIPGIISPEGETEITASIPGVVSSVSFEVGSHVDFGSLLITIEEPFSQGVTKNGTPSGTLREAEIDASLARKTYKEAKRLAEKNRTKENLYTQEISRLKLESAEIALSNIQEAARVRSPFPGIIIEKPVSTGTTVAPGDILARIALSGDSIVKFQVSGSTRQTLSNGDALSVQQQENRSALQARITSIGHIADPRTGKFPIEARLEVSDPSFLNVPVTVLVQKKPADQTPEISLPLSAITTGQEGSFFFVMKAGAARRVPVESARISGETLYISSTALAPDDDLILKSSGTLDDGTLVESSS